MTQIRPITVSELNLGPDPGEDSKPAIGSRFNNVLFQQLILQFLSNFFLGVTGQSAEKGTSTDFCINSGNPSPASNVNDLRRLFDKLSKFFNKNNKLSPKEEPVTSFSNDIMALVHDLSIAKSSIQAGEPSLVSNTYIGNLKKAIVAILIKDTEGPSVLATKRISEGSHDAKTADSLAILAQAKSKVWQRQEDQEGDGKGKENGLDVVSNRILKAFRPSAIHRAGGGSSSGNLFQDAGKSYNRSYKGAPNSAAYGGVDATSQTFVQQDSKGLFLRTSQQQLGNLILTQANNSNTNNNNRQGESASVTNDPSKGSGVRLHSDQASSVSLALTGPEQTSFRHESSTPSHLHEGAQAIDNDSLIEKLVKGVEVQLKEGQEEVSIDLKPDFLGKVRIKVVSEGGHIRVQFLAETLAAKEAIDPHLHLLGQFLERQGFPVQEVSLALNGNWPSLSQGNKRDSGGGSNKRPYSRNLSSVKAVSSKKSTQVIKEANNLEYWA